ncbi:unnamed protein product [Ilex paraguariensis]|uniref:Uncharacterized protein n=1 Tax=Ilex paraguariensis TaxID=185542 RepID=A0ABC8UQB4_9AQUA
MIQLSYLRKSFSNLKLGWLDICCGERSSMCISCNLQFEEKSPSETSSIKNEASLLFHRMDIKLKGIYPNFYQRRPQECSQ